MAIRRHLFLFLLFCANLALARQGNNAPEIKNGDYTHAFIENKGQITDQYHQPRADIDFKIALPGVTVFIGSGQIHYQWNKNEGTGNTATIQTYRLDMALAGANTTSSPLKENEQPYYEQYYLPSVDEEGIIAHAYKKITYHNIYPGIDWVIYCNNNGLKYDFIVHEGANPADIQLQYDGGEKISLEKGGLKVVTPMGSIYENPPYCYEKESGKTVSSYYALDENTVQIITAKHSGSLIIDPLVDFISYYGSNDDETGNAVAADKRGNTYLTGSTSSTTNIATIGAHQSAFSGQLDGFIAAFDRTGNRRWATYFGGADFDNCYDAVCDPDGNIYVCGKTSSNSGIATAGAQQSLYAGGTDDAFLIKFRRNGSREWGTYFGGTGSDIINNVTSDALGNIFVCGATSSSTNISFNNPHQLNLAGQTDGFVARFTPLGQRQWATYYGGPAADAINFNACDLFGNLYIYGTTQSTVGIATPGAHQTAINTISATTFLAKFNIAGTVQWGTYFGGTTGALPGGVVTDAGGNIYICGSTTSTTGISASTGHQLNISAGVDGFISRFDNGGNQVWGSYYGSVGQDNFTGITINPKGRLFVSGITTSNAGFTTPDALQPALNGPDDATLSEWTVNGALVYASYLGGNNNESLFMGNYGSYIEYNFGKVYLCGTTSSTTDLSTLNAFKTTFSGGVSDAYIASQIVDTIAYISEPFMDTLLCEGQQFNLPYEVTLAFDPSNNFTAELSGPIGSFAAPTNIGSVISNTNGGISCTIPFGTPPGTGYKIRIVAINPAYTSLDNIINIRIDNVPQSPLISNGSPGCIGDTLKLAVQSPQTGVDYLWNGPGYNGYAISVSFNKAVPSIVGVYTITPIIGGCTGMDVFTNVTLKPTPAITSKSSNTPICEEGTLFLNANSDMPGSTFTWAGPSFSSSQQNPVVANTTTAATGLYTVTTTFNGCTSKKDSLQVIVKHKPLLTKNTNSPVCETDTLRFSAGDAEQQTQYIWTGPAGFSSTSSANIISNISLSASGRYIVTATNDICSTNDTIDIIIKPIPFPVATNNTPICSGEKLQLSVSAQHSTTKYNWYGPDDFNKTEQNPFIEHARYVANGLYRVIADLDGCIQEDTTTVTIVQAPTTVISSNSPVYISQQLLINASNNLGNATYTWTGPNNFTTNAQNIAINDITTEYAGYYILKTENGKCSTTDSVLIEVRDFLGYEIFILYPSPNTGEFTLKGVVRKDTEIPIAICDMAGHIIYSDKLKTLHKQLDRKIELAGKLASGVYIISIRVDGNIIRKRFTVTR